MILKSSDEDFKSKNLIKNITEFRKVILGILVLHIPI